MKKSTFLLLLLLTTFAFRCSKDDDGNCNPQTAKSGNYLEEMKVGDKIHYSLWTVQNFFSESESQFQYTGDTLELEVISISPNGILISEKITSGSNMMTVPETYYYSQDSVFFGLWNISGDSLFIDFETNYYSSHLTQSPRLKFSDYSEQEVAITGWRTDYNFAEMDAQLYTTDYTLFGHKYDSLSVYIHNSPMAFDGGGTTTVYSEDHGIIRASFYGSMIPIGRGWDRIW